MPSKLTQEDKWALMTMVGIRWDQADKLSDDDAKFLLDRAKEIQDQVQEQQRQMGNTGGGNVNLQPPNYT